MKYQQRLQVAVRERLRKLMTAPYSSAGHEVHLAVTWINRQPALTGLLEEASRAEPDLDPERFRAGLTNGQLSWPSRTEEGQASLIWKLMQEIAKDEVDNPDIGCTVYLVIYNITDKLLELPTDGTPGAWPPLHRNLRRPRLLHPRPRPAAHHHR